MGNVLYWCGIEVFDARLKEYGGHHHWIAEKIFKWKYTHLSIDISRQWRWCKSHEEHYYDGFHNHNKFGFIHIYYGT